MVYVSGLVRTQRCRRWPYDQAAYLWADTSAELDAIARRLGLRPEWMHADYDAPHYDLTAGKRAQAMRFGAREADRRDLAALRAARREKRYAEARAAAKGTRG
jgi:hypothetical protein